MPPVLEPELLQTFIAIAETGRFTEAAKRVGRTQSAVSMQIKRLEDTIGRSLFVREGRTVQLSSDGELLLGHARRVLRAHAEALAAFQPSELTGTVTIGSPDEYAVAFLPTILRSFAETHPQVHVNVVCEPTRSLMPKLDMNEIDIILFTEGGELNRDDGKSDPILLREPVVWAASAKHCVHQDDPVPLALFHSGCRFRQWAIGALADAGRGYRINYTSVSFAGIETAIRAGLAVGAIPQSNVTPGLRILDERDGFPALPDYALAMRRAKGATSCIHDRLEDHIVNCFRQGPPREAAA
ncbi:LysR substrate-binding domain-containing protein [Dichotomicrobium thermohalophilum]|uniref:DNA-binding transcriptional LysR family regulator n=1 Tax=Dichotomicrobium thermohalophilum TaxID=933063 RepID=A0A397QFT2_9HYPH|nr:LysR substrate-binding domain-containing protein [Dichotomicrobium thermohalophilum]RIA56914.1 DNA-binding transcriptional LysR family regulator [Dichotomicrobium thermohalophilum]